MALLVCGGLAFGNMADEHRCNAGGSGSSGRSVGGSNNNRSCKKHKQEKIPQRGLGVAELERIIHDQQRSGNGAATSGLALSPLPPFDPMPAFRPTPALADEDFHSPHFRSIVPNMPPVNNHALHDRSMSVAGGGYDAASVLPHFDPMPNNPAWWYSSPQLRRTPPQHHQQQPMATTSMPFLPSSSGVHLQMEPPSSQINHTSSKLAMSPWKEAEKLPRSFAFDHHISNNDACEIPTFPKPEDTRSPFGLDHFKFGQGTADCRDDNHLPTPGAHQVDHRSPGNILSTGPSTSTVFLDVKSKRPRPIHPPFQASVDELTPPLPHPGRSAQALPFYEFLPPGPMKQEKFQGEQEAADDKLDLDLKL